MMNPESILKKLERKQIMPCTTILVGKKASSDGSNIIARNDDTGAGTFVPKKFVVITPEEQARDYQSVISKVKIKLPDNPMSYTAVPSVSGDEGIWAACGVNEAGVGMTATETITSNPRVQGADPLVVYDPKTGTPGGIGEEDLVYITLPYVKTAREGVKRLGELTETYGTYEMNGIGFSDNNEIWWFESIGGHHWMARRVPDDCYVVMPNQLGIDYFDFDDAYGAQDNFMCSPDLKEFTEKFNLALDLDGKFNPRSAYGSHADSDHTYNTPRAWYIERTLNPHTYNWDGPDADYNPESDDIPWSLKPEKKITVDEVKYLLSNTYQGTKYNPYDHRAEKAGMFRPAGVNRTAFMGMIQNRPGKQPIEWLAFAANPFNVMIPLYTAIETSPEYLSGTGETVNSETYYWVSRLIAAMADASYATSAVVIERYQNKVAAASYQHIHETDALLEGVTDPKKIQEICEAANEKMAATTKEAANETLGEVLYNLSMIMKDAYARSDA